jgi:hypothetical protein
VEAQVGACRLALRIPNLPVGRITGISFGVRL